ncbi:probable receptor-like protein kinase at2g42960 [Phtheirospermum japonicum]|uniref:non-specific serine/threonine protein kinase n=1 Tax=Phtheirospermum japonicum TaxID=374723 RepID=A0A830B895_9LAMI|nr:probable receptor-like protein kinase at2g42960 [Phtheirospermum japonicum]
MDFNFNLDWSKKTHIFHLKVWVLVTIFLSIFVLLIVFMLWCYITLKKKSKEKNIMLPVRLVPIVSKEIGIDQNSATRVHNNYMFSEKDSDKLLIHFKNDDNKDKNGDVIISQSDSFNYLDDDDRDNDDSSGEKKGCLVVNNNQPSSSPELSHLDWGHWFTLRELEIATGKFSKENVIGEGGYGVVYRGRLVNGTIVAVKRLLNNLGQAEKEFRVEVEAIGHVRHKNLVRLLGYCIEGTHRLLVYEYVNNGNLEQWLHGGMSHLGHLTWEGRIKILLGTAKAYVAPEYASSGYLNEKSDVYSFGVVLLEAITGRDPVDDSRPVHEKNLVDWLKMMVGARRSDEVVDPNIETRPSTSSLKRALLTALRCVDPNAEQRPTMSQVVRMLESEEYPIPREGRRRQKERH